MRKFSNAYRLTFTGSMNLSLFAASQNTFQIPQRSYLLESLLPNWYDCQKWAMDMLKTPTFLPEFLCEIYSSVLILGRKSRPALSLVILAQLGVNEMMLIIYKEQWKASLKYEKE